MAGKKPSAKQLAARAKFTAMVKAKAAKNKKSPAAKKAAAAKQAAFLASRGIKKKGK